MTESPLADESIGAAAAGLHASLAESIVSGLPLFRNKLHLIGLHFDHTCFGVQSVLVDRLESFSVILV